jgi:cell wall-associated NlpC family hydrolase
MTRAEFIAAARSYIGTPFHHQGRLPGVGLDCAGVIVCAAAACGYSVQDVQGYGRIPSGGLLEQAVLDHCDIIPFESLQTGDIVLFAFRSEPQHLAVYDNGMLIHAYQDVGKVVENGLDATWRGRLRGCYALRGIQ